jgi:hypothetical protein
MDRHTELARALEKYFAWRAREEAARPPNEYQLRRAERAKRYWLEHGLVKPSQYEHS